MSKIEIIKVGNVELLKKLKKFLLSQNLDYPSYNAWVEKCIDEIGLGYKTAFLAFIKNKVVGDIVFQKDKTDSKRLEMKNLRIVPSHRGMKIASRLFYIAEKYAREEKYLRLIGDAPLGNSVIKLMTQKLGYKIDSAENLYSPDRKEIILIKDLKEGERQIKLLGKLEELLKNINIRLKTIMQRIILNILCNIYNYDSYQSIQGKS